MSKYGDTESYIRQSEAAQSEPVSEAPSSSSAINRSDETSGSGQCTSPDDILNFIGFGPFQVIAFLLSGFTYFAYGSDISIFLFISDSVKDKWNITDTEYAFLPGATAFPNVVGALFFSLLLDKFGRWWPYALCVGWVGIFSMGSAFSTSFPMLIALRCCTSFGIGGIPAITIPTVVEFLPIRSRGSVGVMNMFVAVLGLCLSCGLAWWLIPAYPEWGWRYYMCAVAVPIVLMAVFRLVFYVESPRYLIAKRKFARAWNVFQIIAKLNGKNLTDFITRERFDKELSASLNGNGNKKQRSIFVQVLEIFHPRYLRSTLPMSVIIITESLGYLSSQLFLPEYLERVNVGKYFTLMVTSAAQLPGVLLMAIIIEWPEVGRLNALRFFSFLAMLFFLLLTLIQTSLTIPLFLIFIYFAAGPISGLNFTYISEVYPTAIRSITTSYFYILQALTYLCGSLASSQVVDVSQLWVFPAFFTVVFFVQLCVAFVLNYEPKGRRLRDVTMQK